MNTLSEFIPHQGDTLKDVIEKLMHLKNTHASLVNSSAAASEREDVKNTLVGAIEQASLLTGFSEQSIADALTIMYLIWVYDQIGQSAPNVSALQYKLPGF